MWTYRHHIYDKPGGPKSVELKEIGPRFELQLYKVTLSFLFYEQLDCGYIADLQWLHFFFLALQVKLGTMDQSEAQIEWVYRPYMNTTKKRNFIGNDADDKKKRNKS